MVTTLFVDVGETLEEIARFVGHSRPSTTAGYLKRVGHRPQSVAKRAAGVLARLALDCDPRGSDHPRSSGATLGATAPESSSEAADGGEP